MNATSNTDRLLTAQMLAEQLSLSKRQVHRLNSAGRLPKPLRIGGSVRWSEKIVNPGSKRAHPIEEPSKKYRRSRNAD